MGKLTDVRLRTLLEPGRYFDGQGLYLEVLPAATPTTGRYWRWKFRHGGKEKRMAFGVYPEVSLKEARGRLADARAVLATGADPMQVKRDEAALQEADRRAAIARAAWEASNSFQAVAEDWLKHQAGRWTPGTLDMIRGSLAADVFPRLGGAPMAQIKPREVMAIVQAIEARGAGETAGRVLQRVKAVFRYAVVHERIESNPMLDLKPSEVLRPRQVRHRAALQEADLPAFMAALAAYEGEPTTKAALRLLMLTVLRPGELRGLLWSEVDLSAGVLRIRPERMKMKAAHVVPLSRQACELVKEQKAISGRDVLVFPSPFYPGKPLSENTLNSALARLGFKGIATAHGMRALFSTVANEHGHDSDVIERQLAHKERNEVRAAYHRSTYLPARAELMQWWSDWLDERKALGGIDR